LLVIQVQGNQVHVSFHAPAALPVPTCQTARPQPAAGPAFTARSLLRMARKPSPN
jgi:hypothetical protein